MAEQISNRERVMTLNDDDFVRFVLIIGKEISNKSSDPFKGLTEWLNKTEPGNSYRTLMNDWS